MDVLTDLIGESPAIEAVRRQIRRLLERRQGARHFPPILIQGETGTGKGLIAQLIHRLGPRADGPFVDVNCAAIPETLLEAELFGYERGAFTDARQGKPGLFQTAHRGTIFLDEIGLLPDGLQAKLLKVIEERSVRRLGRTRNEAVDVWILTATNEDLAGATRERRFREDLYHRLAVLTLWVPPLRERGDDVLRLADHFLARACSEYGLPPKSFAADAQAELAAYRWPGNVRELSNVIERVALLAEAPEVTAALLALPGTAPAAPAWTPERARPLAEAMESDERAHLLTVLHETGWNISRAAARLSVTRNTLRYRLEKYGLQRERRTGSRTRRAESPARPAPPAVSRPPAPTPSAPASAARWERRRVTLLRAITSSLATDSPLYARRAFQALVEKAQSFGGQIEALTPEGIVAAFGLEPVEDAPRRAAHAAMAMQKAAERARREGTEPFELRIGIHVGQYLVGHAAEGAAIDPEDGGKIRVGLRELGMDPGESGPYLLQLFGVKEGTERLTVLSDEAIRARTIETFRQLVINGSRQRPMIFVVEDLQWVDRASEDCFTILVEHLAALPILFLATYRPGYRPPWLDKSYATQLALQPLSSQDSLALVRSVLPASPLPQHLPSLILDKAEGNPFFLEEISRAVGEQVHLRSPLAVPDTIQELLLARIDRLPEKAKRLLQTASLLRREFSQRLLGAIWEGPAEPHLDELTRLEFIHEQSRAGEPTYVFKHALIQEVAYESLSASDRRALHAAAARALETLYAGRLEEAYDSLAYHYSRTDDSPSAVEYLTRSAERAVRGYAHEEAVRALHEAVAHVGRLPEGERDRRLIDLLLRQASSLTALGRVQEVLDILMPQQDRLERLGDRALAGHYYFLVGRTYSFLGQYARAAENAERAIAEAQQCGDDATRGKAHSLLAIQAALSGQAQQGIDLGRRAIALLERTGERWWLGYAYWVVSLNYTQTGDFEPALDAAGRAHAIGEDLGDPRLMGFASWVSGLIYAALGDSEAGINACQRALQHLQDPLERAIATGCLGYAYLEKGDAAAAIPLLERSVEQLARFRYRPFQGWFSVFLAEACRRERRLERAEDLALQGLVITRDANFRTGFGWAQQALGRIAESRGAFAEAEARLTAARETFTATRSRYELARTYLDLAGLARVQGHGEAVATNLQAAYRLFLALRVKKYMKLTTMLALQVGVPLADEAS